jgi:hypothetical protein
MSFRILKETLLYIILLFCLIEIEPFRIKKEVSFKIKEFFILLI